MKGIKACQTSQGRLPRELEIRGLSQGFPDCLREEAKTFILLPEEHFPKPSTEEWVMKAELTSVPCALHIYCSHAQNTVISPPHLGQTCLRVGFL